MQPRQRPGNRLGRLVAAFSAAALALLGVVAVPASATNPGGDGKLAFTQRNSAGNTVILTVNHDGTGVTQLTTSGNHFTPTWSPGGNQMAFVYYPFAIGIPVLGVMNADGTGHRIVSSVLATPTDTPSWSSDGTLLAFSETFKGINTVNVATDAKASLIVTGPGTATGNGIEAHFPSYSPDGRYLAWIRSAGSSIRLMLSHADGTNPVVLREWTVENPFISITRPPHWHTDSQKIQWDLQIAEAPAAAVVVANTIGAGDAFCAALVLALRSGLDYSHALAAANAVGADAVGDPSSQPELARLGHYVGRTAATNGAR